MKSIDRMVRWLDRLRRGFLRPLASWSGFRALSRDRSARVCVLAGFGIVVAFLGTLFFPLWLLLLGPIVLGVPHVLADLRYLLLSKAAAVPRPIVGAILVPLAGMTGLRLWLVMGGESFPRLEVLCGLLAIGGALWWTASERPLRWGLVCLLLLASWPLLRHASLTALLLGHLHNFIAFAAWLAWSRGEGPWARYAGVAVLYIGCIGLLGSGLLEPLSVRVGAFAAPASSLDFDGLVRSLAPGLPPTLGFRLVLIFTFAQAIHYVVWLRLVPNNHTFMPKRGPTSFREDFQGLQEDFGKSGRTLALGLCLLVPFFGLLAPTTTRAVYLSLVFFHGWMELAIFAHLLARRPLPL